MTPPSTCKSLQFSAPVRFPPAEYLHLFPVDGLERKAWISYFQSVLLIWVILLQAKKVSSVLLQEWWTTVFRLLYRATPALLLNQKMQSKYLVPNWVEVSLNLVGLLKSIVWIICLNNADASFDFIFLRWRMIKKVMKKFSPGAGPYAPMYTSFDAEPHCLK